VGRKQRTRRGGGAWVAAAVKLQGFLSYLMRCAESGEPYRVLEYGSRPVVDYPGRQPEHDLRVIHHQNDEWLMAAA
jgi:hypothetical protein